MPVKRFSAHAGFAVRGLQCPTRFKQPHCKRLQGAGPVKSSSHFMGQADSSRRASRCPFEFRTPDNKSDAVPCDRLPCPNLVWRDVAMKSSVYGKFDHRSWPLRVAPGRA